MTREWWFRVHFIHAENFSLSTKSNLMHTAPLSADDMRQLSNCGQWFLFSNETKWLSVLENHDNQPIYIYIYVCVCVCVYVCGFKLLIRIILSKLLLLQEIITRWLSPVRETFNAIVTWSITPVIQKKERKKYGKKSKKQQIRRKEKWKEKQNDYEGTQRREKTEVYKIIERKRVNER